MYWNQLNLIICANIAASADTLCGLKEQLPFLCLAAVNMLLLLHIRDHKKL